MISRRPSPTLIATNLTTIALIAFPAFICYGWLRTSSGPLIRGLDEKLRYGLVSAGILSIPALLVTALFLSIQIYRHITRPKRRLMAGLCPVCTYPLIATDAPCPECGLLPTWPAQSTRTAIRKCLTTVALLILSGTTLGSAAAEIVISPDERDFMNEIQNASSPHTRLRQGPFYGEMSFIPGRGYWTVDD